METLLAFKTFADKGLAQEAAEQLRSRDIPVTLEEQPPLLDSNFIGQRFADPYVLKIPGTFFETARRIFAEQTVINMDEVDKDYILFSFSDEELKNVVQHQDEWGLYNYKLALALLAERHRSSAAEEEQLALKDVLPVMDTPKSSNVVWIVVCYIGLAFSIYRLIAMPGRLVFFLPHAFFLLFGYTLAFSKTTLDNGTRIYSYNNNTRLHGLVIFAVSGLLLLALLVLAIGRVTF